MENLILEIQAGDKLGVAKTKQQSGSASPWGKQTTAFPLTQQGPAGSAPKQKGPKWDALAARRTESGRTSYYIRGHLLNANLHGAGVWNNMVPLTRKANAIHSKQIEQAVKIAVSKLDEEHAVYYDVKAEEGPPAKYKNHTPADVRKFAAARGWGKAIGDSLVNIIAAEKDVPKKIEIKAFVITKPDNEEWPDQQPALGVLPDKFKPGKTNIAIGTTTVTNEPDSELEDYQPGLPPQELVYLNLSRPESLAAYEAISEVGEKTAEILWEEKPFASWADVKSVIRKRAYDQLKASSIVKLNKGKTKWQDKT
jgi:hypothetical protein